MLDSTKSTDQKTKITVLGLGLSVVLAWRFPTAEEDLAYRSAVYKAMREKTAGPQLEYGLKVLTGVNDGDFGLDGKPILTAQPDWKECLAKNAEQNAVTRKIIERVCSMAFDEIYAMPEANTVPFATN